MPSRGPYTYDVNFSQIRDADGWSIANVPNPAGLGGPTDAENGALLAASWELARVLSRLVAADACGYTVEGMRYEGLFDDARRVLAAAGRAIAPAAIERPAEVASREAARALVAAQRAIERSMQAAKFAQDAPSVDAFSAAASAKRYADLATDAAERAVNAAASVAAEDDDEEV